MGYYGQGVAQGGIVDTPDHKWYAVLFQDRKPRLGESRFLGKVIKMGEKCQSYPYAGAGEIKSRDGKRKNYPVLGDSGRTLCEVETQSIQDRCQPSSACGE